MRVSQSSSFTASLLQPHMEIRSSHDARPDLTGGISAVGQSVRGNSRPVHGFAAHRGVALWRKRAATMGLACCARHPQHLRRGEVCRVSLRRLQCFPGSCSIAQRPTSNRSRALRRGRPGESDDMSRVTRRDTLIGAGALAGTALWRPRFSFGQGWNLPIDDSAQPPDLPIEDGATLRIVRPSKFVDGDQVVFEQNTKAFTEKRASRSRSTTRPGRICGPRPRSRPMSGPARTSCWPGSTTRSSIRTSSST